MAKYRCICNCRKDLSQFGPRATCPAVEFRSTTQTVLQLVVSAHASVVMSVGSKFVEEG